MLSRSIVRCNMGLGDAYVKKVFDTVASKYDLMNDVLSVGVHRLWKDHFVKSCVRPRPGGKFLDVAGGTGDIAMKILDECRAYEDRVGGLAPSTVSKTEVTVLDINQKMLDEGIERARSHGYNDIQWICASGEELPFPDEQFDSYTVSFGIRNFSDRPKALREAYRVLKVGGVINVLEFSEVTCAPLRAGYDLWSYVVIPAAGRLLADEESYRYLVDSIRAFPNQESFAELMKDAGFGYVRYQNLTGGIACIHTGVKTEAIKSKPEPATAAEKVVADKVNGNPAE